MSFHYDYPPLPSMKQKITCIPKRLIHIRDILRLSNYNESNPPIAFWCRRWIQKILELTPVNEEIIRIRKIIHIWLRNVRRAGPQYKYITDRNTGRKVILETANKLFNKGVQIQKKDSWDIRLLDFFFTASLLYRVLEVFGEEEDTKTMYKKRYSIKASTYLQQCVQKSLTPNLTEMFKEPIEMDQADESDEENIDPLSVPNESTKNEVVDIFGFKSDPEITTIWPIMPIPSEEEEEYLIIDMGVADNDVNFNDIEEVLKNKN